MIGTRLLRLWGLALIAALLTTGIVAAPAAAAVPGLEYVHRDSAPTNPQFPRQRSVRVDCPAGKRVVGAAASVIDPVPAGHTALSAVIPGNTTPGSELRYVVAHASAVPPHNPASWRLRAHAICANPLPGLQLVIGNSQPDSRSAKGVSAVCPPGKKLIGSGGARYFTGNPNADDLYRVVLDEIAPYGNLDGVGVVGVETPGGTTANWYHRAFAICANPLPGLQLLHQVGPAAADSVRTANVFCPQGKSLLSPAGQANAAVSGRSVFWSIIIAPAHAGHGAPPLGAVSVVGGQVPPNLQYPWSVTSYAICANT
jgi:hypothetical protein